MKTYTDESAAAANEADIQKKLLETFAKGD